MKLISINVALFETNNSKLKNFLKAEKPDIACFQEVIRKLEKPVNLELVSKDAIDKVTSTLEYSVYAPSMMIGNFEFKEWKSGQNNKFDIGGEVEFGLLTKSRFPIIKSQNIFVENHYTYTTDFSNWPNEDFRSFQVTDIVVKKRLLRLINYHGIWTRDKQGNKKTKIANQKILKLAKQAAGEVIICGDFNLFPDTVSMQIIDDSFISLVDKYTIRTTRPASNELNGAARNVVDYCFVSKGIKVKDFTVPDIDVSDHLPLILEFDIQR